MAKAAPKKDQPLIVKVNLLHPQGEPLRLGSKFLKWLVGYGRFIVIFVEIIVISCFLYRFKLDSDLDHVNQSIGVEIKNIDSKKAEESVVRQTQQKLLLIQQSYDNSPNWKDLVEAINSKVPQGVVFGSLQLEHVQSAKSLQFRITGTTTAPEQISAFIIGLREVDKNEADRKFTDITLSSITFDAGTINFTVTGATK